MDLSMFINYSTVLLILIVFQPKREQVSYNVPSRLIIFYTSQVKNKCLSILKAREGIDLFYFKIDKEFVMNQCNRIHANKKANSRSSSIVLHELNLNEPQKIRQPPWFTVETKPRKP